MLLFFLSIKRQKKKAENLCHSCLIDTDARKAGHKLYYSPPLGKKSQVWLFLFKGFMFSLILSIAFFWHFGKLKSKPTMFFPKPKYSALPYWLGYSSLGSCFQLHLWCSCLIPSVLTCKHCPVGQKTALDFGGSNSLYAEMHLRKGKHHKTYPFV